MQVGIWRIQMQNGAVTFEDSLAVSYIRIYTNKFLAYEIPWHLSQ
jgi:hypothetical protein